MLIAENSSRKLLDDLGRVREGQQDCHCVHVSFSSHAPPQKAVLYECISNTFSDPDVVVYACEDADLFIIVRGVTLKLVDTFKTRLAAICAGSGDTIFERIDLYKVSHEHNTLMSVVKQKITRIREQEQRQEALDMAMERELAEQRGRKNA